jgi:parvulin-like peptidyl-prolyl isomerase
MRYAIACVLLSAMIVTGCSPKAEQVVLKEGTPAYALAKNLAEVMPALGPEKKTLMVEAKGMRITAAEVIQAVWDNLGTRTDGLKSLDAGRLKSILEQGATQLGERRLILAAATEAKTVVTAEEFDKTMQSQYAQAGGEQAFLDALKNAQISIDHVKKSVQETLLINKYLSGVAQSGATVTEEELRKAYQDEMAGDKTASVRHILLITQNKADQEKAEARKKIEDLLARAKAGEDFAELAKKHSEDPGSKDNGGLYEDFPRGQMVKPFEDAAFSLPVGAISGIVETTFGYHIIKVVDRKKETRPFEEVRGELESRLKETKQGTVVQEYVKQLKEKAKFKLIPL